MTNLDFIRCRARGVKCFQLVLGFSIVRMDQNALKIFCIVLMIPWIFSLSGSCGEVEELVKALVDVVDLLNSTEVTLVADSSAWLSTQLIEAFVRVSDSKLNLRLFDFDDTSKGFLTIFTIENDQKLKDIKVAKPQGNFLILTFNQSQAFHQILFRTFWNFHAFNVNLIFTDTDNTTKMTSFTPFTEGKCDNFESKVINFYNSSQRKWSNQVIFPEKMKNFHKCPIRLATFDYPSGTVVTNSTDISGHDIDMLRAIAVMMNFTLVIDVLNGSMPWGFLLENGTSGGVMKKVIKKEADIGIGTYYLTQTRAKFMSFSEYSDSKIVLVIPPGRSMGAFEKLLRPLNYTTWIALVLTLITGVLIIFIVQKKKSTRHFVFGIRTGNPYMNMLNIILNGSQPVQPGRNFSRVLLTLFVVFCIIIRTTYQASLFQFLRSEQKHGEIKTVDELIEKGFDVFMYESFQELSNGLKIHQR
jgi:hypothetical protein